MAKDSILIRLSEYHPVPMVKTPTFLPRLYEIWPDSCAAAAVSRNNGSHPT